MVGDSENTGPKSGHDSKSTSGHGSHNHSENATHTTHADGSHHKPSDNRHGSHEGPAWLDDRKRKPYSESSTLVDRFPHPTDPFTTRERYEGVPIDVEQNPAVPATHTASRMANGGFGEGLDPKRGLTLGQFAAGAVRKAHGQASTAAPFQGDKSVAPTAEPTQRPIVEGHAQGHDRQTER